MNKRVRLAFWVKVVLCGVKMCDLERSRPMSRYAARRTDQR